MLENDKNLFLQCLTLLAESFNRKVSSLLLVPIGKALRPTHLIKLNKRC